MKMKREDYKAVKRMNNEQLYEYLQRIFRRGYESGFKAANTYSSRPDALKSSHNTTEP